MKLVISRYKEDLGWEENYTSIIYNKGESIPNTISLPNVGREGHTYIYHILSNYENLDEYTVFLQGNPFDHSQDLFYKLKEFEELQNKPDFFHLCKEILMDDGKGKPNHWVDIPVSYYYNDLFKIPRTEFIYGSGAQFIVSKERILSRPKSFYSNIMKHLETHINPTSVYCYERMWQYIFGTEEILDLFNLSPQ
jgi:Protein of unknown function (DUF3431)